jgi:hypothetical protein
VLWNKVAVIEGEILAARDRYERKVEEREEAVRALLREEDAGLGPFLLEVIGGGKG